MNNLRFNCLKFMVLNFEITKLLEMSILDDQIHQSDICSKCEG